MQSSILQNNRCSTHIHIGGQHSGNLHTDSPHFNRRFSAYAIKLGAQVEDSLRKLLPVSRDPRSNRYCASIKKYGKYSIKNKKDFDKLVANYVFDSSNLSKSNNTKTSVNRWTPSRYKWLNLVNCNTDNGHRRNGDSFQTIEFRIFPPTTNPEKLHLWILICQAFVWFVENRQKDIEKGGVTIQQVIQEAYKGRKIMEFIEKQL